MQVVWNPHVAPDLIFRCFQKVESSYYAYSKYAFFLRSKYKLHSFQDNSDVQCKLNQVVDP